MDGSKIRNPKSEIRNDMMTGSSDEPSQNVIPTEGRSGPSGGISAADNS
jgi:hypothetical protein